MEKPISEEKILTTALKRVDFPTLGRPTIPALRLMLILDDDDEEENGLPLPRPPITPTMNRQWLLCCFIGTSRDGIKWLQAILAIFAASEYSAELLRLEQAKIFSTEFSRENWKGKKRMDFERRFCASHFPCVEIGKLEDTIFYF